MSSALLSPRARTRALHDVGERSPLVARQRVPRARHRRRRPLARAARWAAGALLVLLAAGAAGAAWYWVLTTSRFAISSVEVRGASRVPAEQILAAAGITPGTSVWRLDAPAIVARVETIPEIQRADVVRALPDRVTILVEERRPFTLVHAGRLHWLDEEGRLLGAAREAVTPPVPVISGLPEEELVTMRTAPGPRARAAIGLIRALLRSGSGLSAEISEIDMSGTEGPVLYTVDGVEVRLGVEDWEDRLARLEGVLAQVAAQDGSVNVVDLRFRDQVVLQRGGQR
ncbi:MAG: FtsQ-type POTRA domain-containing protein [Candidatus Rokubacteria bacterium]|nr:FtsQ-type POTRA domain-containing protein [Candidatus Rokubacteria bacterium]